MEELRSEKERMQLDKIESLEKEVSEHRKKAANDKLLQNEINYLKRQHSNCKTDTKNVSSEIPSDSVFEEPSAADNVFNKHFGFNIEKQNSRSLSVSGTKEKENQSSQSIAEDGVKLKQRDNSIGEDVIKLKQRNREDIARLRQTKSVQSIVINNSNTISKVSKITFFT